MAAGESRPTLRRRGEVLAEHVLNALVELTESEVDLKPTIVHILIGVAAN